MNPVNDNVKVLLETDAYGFGGTTDDKSSSGIVVEVPEVIHYFGMHSMAFEESFMSGELGDLLDFYRSFVGQRVFWSSGKQLGSVIQEDDKVYAFLKFTDIICVGDKEINAKSLTNTSTGAISI